MKRKEKPSALGRGQYGISRVATSQDWLLTVKRSQVDPSTVVRKLILTKAKSENRL